MHVFRRMGVCHWRNHGGPFALEVSRLALKMDGSDSDLRNDINNRLLRLLEPMNGSELVTVATLLSYDSTVLSKWKLGRASS